MCKHVSDCDGCQCPFGHPPCSHCVEDHDRIDGPHTHFIPRGERIQFRLLAIGDEVRIEPVIGNEPFQTYVVVSDTSSHQILLGNSGFALRRLYSLKEAQKMSQDRRDELQRSAPFPMISRSEQLWKKYDVDGFLTKPIRHTIDHTDPDGPPAPPAKPTWTPADNRRVVLASKYSESLFNALRVPPPTLRSGDIHKDSL